VTRTHVYTWHDHRLAPPPGLPAGSRSPWRFAVALDGRPTELAGSFERIARPAWWPWLAGAAAALALIAAAGRAVARRARLATPLAFVAAAAAVVASAGYTTGDSLAGTGRWLQVAALAVLAALAVGVLAFPRWRAHTWVAMVIGLVAGVLCLGSASVFWHGVVISSLPDWAARLTTAVAVVAGFAATGLAALADDDAAPPRGARRLKESSRG
jgi:hypothetical protein